MNAIRIVAFDCDGVLFNTDRVNQAYYNTLLRHVGKPLLTADQFSFVHMHPVAESVRFLFPDPGEREKAERFRQQMDYLPFVRDMEMTPGLIPVLTRLRQRYKTAIATNRTDTMNAVMTEHGLADYFDMVVCARDVIHPKPHPEPLFKILRQFQAASNQAVYVGDSKIDAEAAEGAGIFFVAYRNPTLSTDYHIHRMEDLEPILDSIGANPG